MPLHPRSMRLTGILNGILLCQRVLRRMRHRMHHGPHMLPLPVSSIRLICRVAKTATVTCATVWALAGCEAPVPPAAVPVAQVAAAFGADDVKRLDALMTPVTIFPDSAQRALYEMHAPVSENGRRSYVFELKAQPGMVADRHFQLITITWARAGTFVGSDGKPRLVSTGGPGGAIVDALAQTADKAYDLQVSEAMLLPETVQVPQFDLDRAAATLVQSYGASASR